MRPLLSSILGNTPRNDVAFHTFPGHLRSRLASFVGIFTLIVALNEQI